MFSKETMAELARNEGKSREALIHDMKALAVRMSLIQKAETRTGLSSGSQNEKKQLLAAIASKRNAIMNAGREIRVAKYDRKTCALVGTSGYMYSHKTDLYKGI